MIESAINRILKRMWNCRGKQTTTIDKVKMETIIKEELSVYSERSMNDIDTAQSKQEPVLDKIRAEIKALSPEPTASDVVDGNPIKDAVWETIADVLAIIDKYKTGEGEE